MFAHDNRSREPHHLRAAGADPCRASTISTKWTVYACAVVFWSRVAALDRLLTTLGAAGVPHAGLQPSASLRRPLLALGDSSKVILKGFPVSAPWPGNKAGHGRRKATRRPLTETARSAPGPGASRETRSIRFSCSGIACPAEPLHQIVEQPR